jgi:Tfp pilus assembly protein PilF
LAQHSATVLNIPAICDSKIQIDATTLSLCTNAEQSSSPQTLPDELLVQQQLTKLEIMCAQLQDENEKLIREASQHKKEQIRQCNYAFLLQTGKKELDKAEELYKKALQAEPHRAPTLFNYAAYLHKCGRVQEGRDMYARACLLEQDCEDCDTSTTHKVGLKCGGTISERANTLWATKNISIISQLPQELLAP